MKDIMGATAYADYKAIMACYLAPNSIHNHGRFCCAYCEVTFFDQWLLEQVESILKEMLSKVNDEFDFSI